MATGAAQEMLGNIPCDICETYKDVIWRCQSCPETLCNQCKIYHLKSKPSRDHKVTELANVTEKNQSSSIFCPNHQSEAFHMYCTTCGSLVCLRCITEIHKLHEYKMMEDIAKETKTQLENVFEQIKTNQIPKLEMSAVAITEMQENYSQEKEKLMKSITTRGDDIKLAVDQIINKLRDESIQQATADETCLTVTKEKIDLELTILKKQLNEEEQRVRNFSDVDMIVKAVGIKDSLTQLTKRSSEIHVQPIQPPKFQIGQDNDSNLKTMVGQLIFEVKKGKEQCIPDQTGEKQNQSQADPNVTTGKSAAPKQTLGPVDFSSEAETTKGRQLSQSTEDGPCGKEKRMPILNKNSMDLLSGKDNVLNIETNEEQMNLSTDKSKFEDADKVPVNHPNEKSKIQDTDKVPGKHSTYKSKVQDSRMIKGNIVSSFQWKKYLSQIKLVNHNEAWLVTGIDAIFNNTQYCLELVNEDGKQIKSISPVIWSMALTKGSDLLVTEFTGCKVMQISRSCDINIFADLSPYHTNSIHVTQNGDVLVGLFDSTTGSRVTRLSSQGKTLQTIHKKTIDKYHGQPCCITENVNQDMVILYDWVCIEGLDKTGKFRFEYKGPKQIKMNHVFKPVDVICNQDGQILVADKNNGTIHLLDKDGNFIQFILDHPQVLKEPTALAIDGTNTLWVGCNDGQVFLVDLF